MTGLAAKQGIIRHAGNTIQGVLRVAGATEEEGCGHARYEGTCTPSWDGGRTRYSVQRGEKTVMISAEDVLTHIFTLLKGQLVSTLVWDIGSVLDNDIFFVDICFFNMNFLCFIFNFSHTVLAINIDSLTFIGTTSDRVDHITVYLGVFTV